MSNAAGADVEGLPPLRSPAASSGIGAMWRERYLLSMLVRNTIKSRYQGTALGWVWSYIQPAMRFAMFYFIFQIMIERFAELPSYAIHLFAGMIIVHFFTETFNTGTTSLVRKRKLITKLAMPKALFPVSQMLVSLWHTVPMLAIITLVCFLTGWQPDWVGIGAGLLAFVIIVPFALALALVFSIANVFLRDFSKVVATLTQFVTFSVPMIYPFTFVHERFGEVGAQLYLLNPVAEAVLLLQRCFWVGMGDREQLIADHMPDDLWLRGGIMAVVSLLLLLAAQTWFSRLEGRVAERV